MQKMLNLASNLYRTTPDRWTAQDDKGNLDGRSWIAEASISFLTLGKCISLLAIVLPTLAVAVFLLQPVTMTQAATINVTCNVNDLINAINTANSNGEPDTIILTSDCLYTLAAVNNGSNGLPLINTPITINGNGAVIKRSSEDGTPNFRIFQVNSSGQLYLNDLTIENGRGNGVGGGIYNNWGEVHLTNVILKSNLAAGGTYAEGGGIHNYYATLIITNSTFISNSVSGGSYSNAGGSISSSNGTVTIINSTLSGSSVSGATDTEGGSIYNHNSALKVISSTLNSSSASGATAFNQGGGIYNDALVGTSTVDIINSTLSGNSASQGGAIYNQASFATAAVNLTNSTLSSNTGGGIYNRVDNNTTGPALVNFTNSIITGAAYGNNCINVRGTITGSNSLADDHTCSGVTNSNLINLDPVLRNNGGSTLNHALLPGSVAVDAGDNAVCTTSPVNGVDQRGTVRPQGSACDIGAYEATPILTLSKDVDDAMPSPGQVITYTIIITNSGALSATNVSVSDTLPLGLSFVGPITIDPVESGVAGNSSTLPILVDDLTVATGKQVTITFPITVDDNLMGSHIITNTASVTSTEVNTPIYANVPTTIASVPAVTITKMASKDVVSIGETITYTYQVTNAGNVSLTNIVASDTPLGLVPLDKSSLRPDQSTTGILTYTVIEADLPDPLTNTVIVTGTFIDQKITATVNASVSVFSEISPNEQLYLPLILKDS
jgi:uncharacterized repeat protein (TIGR01451 family)